jgi:hypothetical protein
MAARTGELTKTQMRASAQDAYQKPAARWSRAWRGESRWRTQKITVLGTEAAHDTSTPIRLRAHDQTWYVANGSSSRVNTLVHDGVPDLRTDQEDITLRGIESLRYGLEQATRVFTDEQRAAYLEQLSVMSKQVGASSVRQCVRQTVDAVKAASEVVREAAGTAGRGFWLRKGSAFEEVDIDALTERVRHDPEEHRLLEVAIANRSFGGPFDEEADRRIGHIGSKLFQLVDIDVAYAGEERPFALPIVQDRFGETGYILPSNGMRLYQECLPTQLPGQS